jgi:hypothetical protein
MIDRWCIYESFCENEFEYKNTEQTSWRQSVSGKKALA